MYSCPEKYVWTTGAWLSWKYLHTASPREVERLDAAIRRGDIVWNSVPYTVESESMNQDLFETSLLLSHKLDEKYGKKTILSIIAEKVGERVDLFDVVERGNRQQHGIDRYVDLVTSTGTIRIWSEAAFLVNIGEAKGINYSLEYPDKQGGIHFNLSNNLWNTNFCM